MSDPEAWEREMKRRALLCFLSIAPLLEIGFVGGCAAPFRKHAVPAALQNRAVIPGMRPDVRTWADEADPQVLRNMARALACEPVSPGAANEPGVQPKAAYLAISGGGANGAFGAGFLNGWTAAGTRPEFKVVTGISTGALIAPFAFLGPEYDEVLHRFYTTLRSENISKDAGCWWRLCSTML
jgi:hypothetical protein